MRQEWRIVANTTLLSLLSLSTVKPRSVMKATMACSVVWLGIEADRHLAFRIGRFAGSDALLLAKHGVEAGGAGDAAESLDQISHRLARSRSHAFERSQAADTRQGH